MSASRTALRTTGVAIRAMLVFTLVLGGGYLLVVTALGQLVFPAQANGSLVRTQDGELIGSALLGQSFTDAGGTPLPQYFQSRPSAAGYDGGASSGSNLGPNNDDLVASIEQRRTAIADSDGVAAGDVPADAVTASGSGLDPDISPDYAYAQVARVAAARGLDERRVRDLVASHVQARDWGYLGGERVNVLELNLALDDLSS